MIIAVGGSASVGKTTLATALASRLGLEQIVHVDDIAAGHEQDVASSFISATPDVWRRSADWRHEQLLRWTAGLHPRIGQVIDELVGDRGGVVEGEGIEPRLLRRWEADLVRVVYIVETDATVLHDTFATRPSDGQYLALPAVDQAALVEMNLRYGRWLRDTAEAHQQPWVSSQPWTTLPDRALDALRL